MQLPTEVFRTRLESDHFGSPEPEWSSDIFSHSPDHSGIISLVDCQSGPEQRRGSQVQGLRSDLSPAYLQYKRQML